MTKDRLVRERMAQTGETYLQASAQLSPRGGLRLRYAETGETEVEALTRAYRADLPVVAHGPTLAAGPERMTPSTALRLLRLRDTTLRGLARGRNEEQLAAESGLSPHAVRDYVKTLYRYFGARNPAELLAACRGESVEWFSVMLDGREISLL